MKTFRRFPAARISSGRTRTTGPNKLETAYAFHLAALQQAGKVLSFAFEPEKLRLADATFYAPDFRVILPDGSIEFHEVKGHWEDDARVKIKVAAELHPYRFLAITKGKGGWEFEELPGPAFPIQKTA